MASFLCRGGEASVGERRVASPCEVGLGLVMEVPVDEVASGEEEEEEEGEEDSSGIFRRRRGDETGVIAHRGGVGARGARRATSRGGEMDMKF